MREDTTGRQRKTAQMIIVVYLAAMVAAEWVFHSPDTVRMHPYLKSPLFMMKVIYMEDWATYGVMFALFIPLGALLWRYCKHGLIWFLAVLCAVLIWEIVQPLLGIDYFRLYVVLAGALGLLTGRLWNAVVNWAAGRKATLWGMLLVSAGVAFAAENTLIYGHTPYEAMTIHFREGTGIVMSFLWYGVLLGKAVCLSSITAALSGKKWAVWLCALLLCVTMPRDIWMRSAANPLAYFLPYALCAVGCALFCHVFLFDGAREGIVKKERTA